MDHLSTLIGHILIFLATMAGFAFQWMREGRQHRWQQEQFNRLNTSVNVNRNGRDHQ